MANDTLYDVLVGIDEGGSTSVMNKQLEKIGKGLKDLDIKVKLDKDFKDSVKRTFDSMKFDAPKGMFELPNSNLLEGHEEKIKEALKAYEEFGYTVTKISGDTKEGFQGLSLEVQDLQGNFSKITLDADLVEKSRTLFTGFEKGVKNYKVSLADLQKQLTAVYKTQAAGKGNEQTKEREKQLVTQLNTKYGEYINYIKSATAASDVRKKQLVVEANLSAKTAEKNFENAKSVGQNMKAYASAEKSLELYKRRLKEIQDIQAGKNIGFTEAQVKQSMGGLKANINKFDDLKQKMLEFDAVQERTLKSQAMQRWEKQYTRSINNVEKELGQLETAYINLDYAETRGETANVNKYTAQIEKLKTSITSAGETVLELGKKLGALDEKADLDSLGIDFKKIEASMRDSSAQANVLNNKFGEIIATTRTGKGTKSLVEEFMGGPKDQKNLEKLGEAIYGVGAEYVKTTRNNSGFLQMSDKLTYSVKDQDGVWRRYTVTLDTAQKEIRQTEIALDQTKKTVSGFSNSIMDAAKKIATWGISTKIVYGTWRAFQDGIKTVKELDVELTQIAIVQGTTRDSAKALGEEYSKTAVKMAQTVQDVSKLNTELIRQGLSLEEAASRAETIMKLSSAGMVSMEQSLQVITTGVNALGETHQRVADVILKASMLSASDVEGLGEAFSKTASGAKAAGLSIEETSALLSTMKEVTQEGDSQLGTSLKSMLARFSKINEETGELNKDLNQVQTAIQSVGVQFLDSEGQIRSFYDIVEDLSVGWSDLDKNTQAYIATQAAGVRQQNRFFAVMDNFNKVQAINNDLAYSAGTLQNSYRTYMESSEAAAKKLEASIQRLWVNFLDSDVIIFMYDVAISLVKLVEKFGVLESAIFAITSAVMMKNLEKYSTFFIELVPKIAAATKALLAYKAVSASNIAPIKGIAELQGQLLGGTGAITVASQGLVGVLKTGAIAVGKFFLPMLAAAAIAFAIGKIVKQIAKVKKEAEEARTALLDMANAAQGRINSQNLDKFEIEDTLTKIQEYRTRLNELNTGELQDYYHLNELLLEKVPAVATQIDAMGRTVVSYTTTLEDVNKEFDILVKKDFKDFQDNMDAIFEEERKLVFEEEGIDEIQAKLDQLNKDLNKGPQATLSGKAVVPDKAAIQQEIDALIADNGLAFQNVGKSMMGLVALGMQTSGEEISNVLLQAFANPVLLEQVGSKWKEGMTAEDIMSFEEIQQIKTAFDETFITISGQKVAVNDLQGELAILFDHYERGILTLPEYQAALNAAAQSTLNLKDGSEVFTEAIRNQIAVEQARADQLEQSAETEEELYARRKSNLEDYSASYLQAGEEIVAYENFLHDLNGTLEEQNAAYEAINAKHPEWAWMMNDKLALSQAIQDAMKSEEQIRFESYANMLLNTSSFLQSSSSGYQQYVAALAGYYRGDITNYAELEKSKAVFTENLITKLGGAWAKYFKAVNGAIVFSRDTMERDLRSKAQSGMMSFGDYYAAMAQADASFGVMKTELSTVNSAFDKLIGSIDLSIPPIEKVSTGLNKMAKAGKAAGSGAKSAADGAKAAADAIKEYNEAMKATQDATKEVFDFALKYIKWIEEQKREEMEKTFEDAEKAAEDAYNTIEETLEKEKDAQLEVLAIKEKNIKAEDELLEYLKKRQELQEGIVDLEYQIAIASFDSTVGGVKRRRELEETLAEERKQLAETEEQRLKRMEEEAYAREKAFIESQAEWERIQAEETKNTRIANAQAVFDAEKAFLDKKYSDENKYLLAKQATQSGMIANLQGEMIPLVAAFKELAIANGEFWTFFGQQEVADFGTKVASVLESIKKLGFETIQTWKEVASAAEKATNAANTANAASSASRNTSSPTPSPKPTPTPTPATRPDASASVIREFQRLLNLVPSSGSSIKVDGSFGGLTTAKADRASAQLRKSAQGKAIANSVDSATVKTLTTSLNQALANAVKATPTSRTGMTVSAYADGGKVDYTGPALVHGSKSKPEYVFNYAQFKDLAKMIARHELTMPDLKNISTSQPIQINIDRFIEVKGSVDKNTLPELQRMSDNAVAQLTTKLKGWGK